MSVPEHIFRQYDIRGLVADELTPEVCEGVGRAYATMASQHLGRPPRIAVGQDNRPSSPAMAEGLIRGLNDSGADVMDIGTVPTPTLYWAERVLPTDGGIQITGSHNPPRVERYQDDRSRGCRCTATGSRGSSLPSSGGISERVREDPNAPTSWTAMWLMSPDVSISRGP